MHPVGWPTVSVATQDLIRVEGAISAGAPPGAVSVISRLPWQAALAGAGTITPPPVVTVNAGLPPCVAESTAVTATSPVTAGQTIALSVASQPLRPLLVVADWSIAHLSLGSFGWTQVNVFSAHRIADDLGILGTPIPASTDPSGQWSWSLVTPATPVLSNVDVHFDVYVIDYAAQNGVFQQVPAIIHFN